MKEFLLLKLLDNFEGAFTKSGVEYNILRDIIQLKLTMDSRRVTNSALTSFNSKKRNSIMGNRKRRNKSTMLILGYLLVGFFISFLFATPVNLNVMVSLITALFFVFIGTLIISNYSTILLDTKDKNIILSRPVDSKTLSAARMIHLIYYLGMVSVALMIFPMICAGIKFSPIVSLILFVEILFLDILIIGIVTILYATILKFFDGEKLKDIINITQIILGILMFLFTQIPSYFSNYISELNKIKLHSWYIIIPSFWFESPFHLIYKDYNIIYVIGTILAIIVPIFVYSLCKILMPSFERNLGKLDSVSSEKKVKNIKVKDLLITLLCRNKEERAFFSFAFQIMDNEREFKLKLYPIIGKALIMPFIFIFIFGQKKSFYSIRHSDFLYLMFYFVTIYLISYVYFIGYSINYKGAWIYFILPIKDKRNSYNGALKAFIVKIVMPAVIISSIVMLIMFGVRTLPDVIIFILITIGLVPLTYKCSASNVLPFTIAFGDKNMGNGMGRILVSILLLVIGVVQFLISSFVPYGIVLFIILSLIFCYGSWKFSFAK